MTFGKSFSVAGLLFSTLSVICSVSAQSDAERKIGAANQPDSPIQISALALARMPNESVRVTFQLQNVGTKAIRTAAFEAVDSAGGKQVSTAFFCSSIQCGIAPGVSNEGGLTEEDGGFDYRRGVVVRVDFVLFMDGTSWGGDRNSESKVSFGYEKGFTTALEFTRRLLGEGDGQKLAKLLSTSLSDSDIATITGRSDNKWIKGYRFGYNLTIGSLLHASKCYGRVKCSGLGGLETELEKFERTLADAVR